MPKSDSGLSRLRSKIVRAGITLPSKSPSGSGDPPELLSIRSKNF